MTVRGEPRSTILSRKRHDRACAECDNAVEESQSLNSLQRTG